MGELEPDALGFTISILEGACFDKQDKGLVPTIRNQKSATMLGEELNSILLRYKS